MYYVLRIFLKAFFGFYTKCRNLRIFSVIQILRENKFSDLVTTKTSFQMISKWENCQNDQFLMFQFSLKLISRKIKVKEKFLNFTLCITHRHIRLSQHYLFSLVSKEKYAASEPFNPTIDKNGRKFFMVDCLPKLANDANQQEKYKLVCLVKDGIVIKYRTQMGTFL